MSRSWKTWSNEESTSADAPPRARRHVAHIPSTNAQQALWTAAKRIGTSYRFLKLDLEMLAVMPQHADVVSAIAAALQSLGRALLLELGSSPLHLLVAARSEVQELVGLLSSVASRAGVYPLCATASSAGTVSGQATVAADPLH